MAEDSFPRQKARTRGFTLGAPRSFRVAEDGSRVSFIRSKAGDDPQGCLWVFDVETGEERLIFDPSAVDGGQELTQDERDRRERMREQMTGVTTYDADDGLTFADVRARRPGARRGPRRRWGAPVGARRRGSVRRQARSHGSPRGLRRGRRAPRAGPPRAGRARRVEPGPRACDDDPDVHWGIAEFAASEELDRHRGFWWSPDGERIAAARVDERSGARVAHRVTGGSGCAAPSRSVPAGRDRQRGRVALDPRARRFARGRRLGPRRLPVPRRGDVERSMPAHPAGPVPRSEALARARGRPRLREDAGAHRAHRGALADDRHRCARPPVGRTARVRGGERGHPSDHAGR